MINKFIISIVLLHFIFLVKAQQNVQITNCLNGTSTKDFSVGGSLYRPLVCNYTIEFLQEPNGSWYISPTRQYTTNGHNLIFGSDTIWTWDYDPNNSTNSVNIAKNKLITDLTRIRSLGFTEIRLIGAGLINTGTGSAPVYTYQPAVNRLILAYSIHFFHK